MWFQQKRKPLEKKEDFMMHEKCFSRKIAVAFALCESSEKKQKQCKSSKNTMVKISKNKTKSKSKMSNPGKYFMGVQSMRLISKNFLHRCLMRTTLLEIQAHKWQGQVGATAFMLQLLSMFCKAYASSTTTKCGILHPFWQRIEHKLGKQK